MKKSEKIEKLNKYTSCCLISYYRTRKKAFVASDEGNNSQYFMYKGISEGYLSRMLMAIGMHKTDGDALQAGDYLYDMAYGEEGLMWGCDDTTPL